MRGCWKFRDGFIEIDLSLWSFYDFFCRCTLLGVQSWVRLCRQEFGEFPRTVWAVGSYSSDPPAGGTLQILVGKTSPMTGRLRVYRDGQKSVLHTT